MSLKAGHSHDVIELSGWLPSIRIGNALEIPTYYLVISLAFCLGVYWLSARATRARRPRSTAMDAGLAVMIGGFLGARLTHVFYEAPAIYLAEPERVARIWEGGFVWYGGALGAFAAAGALLKLRKQDLGPWLDVFAPIAAAGYSFGRLACLLTGCCFGRVCVLPNGSVFRFPTQAFAVLWEALAVVLLLWIEKRRDAVARRPALAWTSRPGALFAVWVFAHAAGRLMMELYRGDDRGPMIVGQSLSTFVSIALLIATSAVVAGLGRRSGHRSGRGANSRKSGL